MIDLYYWTTPNGHKVTMFLEEAKLPYRLHGINISKGEQFAADFLRVSPNNKIPAIVDHAPADGGMSISVFESGAILLYLAGKTGKFIPKTLRGQVVALEWLMWQMGGLGPMLGQNHHFQHYAPEKIPYAIDRYVKETNRLYGVLDKRLAGRAFILGKAVLDRRHGRLPVDHPGAAGAGPRRLPEPGALARRDQGAPGDRRGPTRGRRRSTPRRAARSPTSSARSSSGRTGAS